MDKDKYTSESEMIKNYLRKKEDAKYQRKKLGKLCYLKYLPYPNQVISSFLLLVLAIVAVGYFPVAVDFIVLNWLPEGVDNRTIFLVSAGWALTTTALFATVLIFGGPVRQFLKARIPLFGNKDVIEMMTTSGKKIYMNQKDEVGGVYELDNDKAVETDPNSFYTGPGGVRMTSVMPELPITFNPRKLLEGYGLGLDMMTLKTYGIKHEQKQWERMKSGKEWIQPFLMPLIILVIIGLILGPFFYQKMGESDEVSEWRSQYEQCRVEMIDAGVTPKDLQKKEAVTEEDKTSQKQATTGASIK